MRYYLLPMRRAGVVAVICALFLILLSPATDLSSRPGGDLVENEAAATSGVEGSGVSDSDIDRLPGAAEMRAMALAYPSRIDRAEVRDGEWALLMDGRWYFWAGGRLLPEELKDTADEFVSIRFYGYELGPVKEPEITPELEARIRDRSDSASETDTRLRFNDFLDSLYQVDSRDAAERTMVGVGFLGRWGRVHPFLVEPLARTEERIREAAASDRSVADWVDGVSAVHGYNWRYIAGTLRRSYHSYGVAVDLTPRSYGGKWAYWLWAAESGVEWWKLPLDQRWQVPQPVVDAFEANGFVWGGKWLFFDNLHFEYRPESILMARPGSE